MIARFLSLLALLVTFSTCAQAQVFKCNVGGKTVLTDRPCDADKAAEARSAPREGGTVDSDNPIDIGKAACAAAVRTRIPFDDPESVRLGTVSGGKTEVFDFADTKLAARRFVVPVNAKNSYGAYTGEKSAHCFTSPDGRRVLKVDTALLR